MFHQLYQIYTSQNSKVKKYLKLIVTQFQPFGSVIKSIVFLYHMGMLEVNYVREIACKINEKYLGGHLVHFSIVQCDF